MADKQTTHGSPELDEDARKLEALGADPGPTFAELQSRRRVPALDRRYPPGCPDADWCAGNNLCYWECTRGPDDDLCED